MVAPGGYLNVSCVYCLHEPGSFKNCSMFFRYLEFLDEKSKGSKKKQSYLCKRLKIIFSMSLKNNTSFNKEYYLQIHFQTNIHRGEKSPNQTSREVNLHGKLNTCQLLFIRDSKITSPLFCPNALFFYFGSCGLMSPEHWSLFLIQVS